MTAETSAGESVFARVEEIEPVPAGIRWHGVWGWDEPPVLPYRPPGDYVPTSLFPPVGGVRVTVVEFPPGAGTPDGPPPQVAADAAAFLARLTAASETARSQDHATGMHATNTADVAVVVDGEVWLEQGNGDEQLLKRGDVLLQMGADHAWRNRSSVPCTVAFVVIGLERTPD